MPPQVPLHAPTVFLVTLLVTFIMSVVVLVFWRFNRGLPGIRDWGLSALAGLVMLASVGIRDRLPELVAVWLTNACIVLMPYFGWSGCRNYLGLARPNWRWALMCGMGVLVLMTFLTVMQPSFYARIALQSLIAGGLYGLVVKTIAVGGWRRYPARYSFAWVAGVHGFFMLTLRPWLLMTGNADVASHRLALANWILLESMVIYMLLCINMLMLVTEQVSAKLVEQSEMDALTKVFNRRAFLMLLQKTRSRCERQGLPLSLMMIDLDHFKHINDSWGHQAGDQVLRQFAKLMGTALRNEDVMGRLGGEEFGILLPGVPLHEAQDIAERVRQACEADTVVFEHTPIRYTISIGIALVQGDKTHEAAIRTADQAMYRAKHGGRNCVEVAFQMAH